VDRKNTEDLDALSQPTSERLEITALFIIAFQLELLLQIRWISSPLYNVLRISTVFSHSDHTTDTKKILLAAKLYVHTPY